MADVIVIGGANVDIKAKAIAPNVMRTSNPGIVSTTAGGVGRNIAHNLARLGAGVSLISVVGQGPHGDMVLETTSRSGVDVSRVMRSTVSTGTYVALLDHDGEMISALNDMRAVEAIVPPLIDMHAAAIAAARYVVADCNLPLESLIHIASLAGGKLIIEPVSVPKSAKLVEVLKHHCIFLASPNLDQMEHLAGTRDIGRAFAFLHRAGLANAVLHAGSEGAFASTGHDISHVPAQPAGEIIDVTGAGDAAVAGLVYGLLKGESLVNAARLGQTQAGKVIASATSTLE